VTEVALKEYGLVPANRTLSYTGAKYQALPSEAIQIVWQKADSILKEVTEVYYGRSKPKATAGPAK
jgi:hypothetical protein